MKQNIWYPIILILLAIATCVVVLIGDFGLYLRPLLVFTFLFVCPGLAFVRLLGLGNPILQWTLAVALSIAIDTAVAEVMLYAGLWSPERSLGLLTMITLAGALLQLWRLRTTGGCAQPHQRPSEN